MDGAKDFQKEEPREETPLVNKNLDKKLNKLSSGAIEFKDAIIIFLDHPKDIIVLYILLFLVVYAFGAILSSITLYFTDIWDSSDFEAGYIIGIYGLMTAVASYFTGVLPHKLGLKLSITIGGIFFSAGLVALALSESFTLSVVSIYTATAIGNSLSLPMAIYSIRFYSSPKVRLITNSLTVLVTCFCFIFLGATISLFWELHYDDPQMAYSSIFMSGAVAAFLSAIIIHFVGESRYADTKINREERVVKQSDVFITKRFWRYMFLILLLTILFGVFNIYSISLGKYMTRELGEDVNWGSIFTIVSVVKILSVLAFSPCLFIISSYTLIISGLLISALSFYFFTFPSSYSMCCLFGVFFGIGNSLFQPRLTDYITKVAPLGHEGIYMAFLVFPNYVSLLFAGLMSGFLLEEYCPEDGERNCWMMWMIATAIAVPTALVLFFSRAWIEQPKIEEQPYVWWSAKSKSPENN